MGITLITVTSHQVYNMVEFSNIARQLAHLMNLRLRNVDDLKFYNAQRELRDDLL